MSTMTLSRPYLLFYLFVSSILTCGLSRRIPRGSFCPSCSQDCPEALTVQLPARDSQELNLRDFSITSNQNSLNFRVGQEEKDETHDNILLNHNSMFRGNRRFPQQQSNRNYFFENRLNDSPTFLDRQETFSQNKPVSKYPLVFPSRRYLDRPKNLYFRNPRNKNSEILSEDNKMTKANKKMEEISITNEAAYRVDREVKPLWKNSIRDTSATQPERSFLKVENIHRFPREDTIDEEKSVIKKSSSSANQFKYSQGRYNPVEFGPSEVERIPFNKDTDLSESMEEIILDDWDVIDKESSNSNLERLRNNSLEVYLAKESEIAAKNDNKISSNYNYNIPLNSHHDWKLEENEKFLDSSIRPNTKPFKNKDDKDVKEYFKHNTEHFMNKENMKNYFEDEIEQSSVEIVQNNPHILSQHTWKDIGNEHLLDNLDLINEDSQETEELGLYSGRNNKYSQEKDVIFQDKAYTSAEILHAPVITAHNAYIIPRYLNIVNNKNYPIKSEMQELLEIENSVHANSEKGMNQRFFEDEAVMENRAHIQNLIFPNKNTFEKEYSNFDTDKQNDTRPNKIEIETVTETDLDLSDTMDEDLSLETTEILSV